MYECIVELKILHENLTLRQLDLSEVVRIIQKEETSREAEKWYQLVLFGKGIDRRT